MTALTPRESTPLSIKPPSLAQRMGLSDEQLNLIRATVAKGATDTELEFFLETAKRTGLDPIAKQIYFVKYGGAPSIITGIDGFRSLAERTGEYDGQDAPSYTFKPNGKIESSTVTVYRKGMGRGISATAFWDEYAVPNGQFWIKMPRNQIAKCAEALALRKAFPRQMGGVYTWDEMEQAKQEGKPLSSVPSPASSEPPGDPPVTIDDVKRRFVEANLGTTLGRWLNENVDKAIVPGAKITDDMIREAMKQLQAIIDGKQPPEPVDAEFTETTAEPEPVADEYAWPTDSDAPVAGSNVALEASEEPALPLGHQAGQNVSEATNKPRISMATKQQKGQIHMVKARLKWDDHKYRAWLYEHYNVTSSTELTEPEADDAFAAMTALVPAERP